MIKTVNAEMTTIETRKTAGFNGHHYVTKYAKHIFVNATAPNSLIANEAPFRSKMRSLPLHHSCAAARPFGGGGGPGCILTPAGNSDAATLQPAFSVARDPEPRTRLTRQPSGASAVVNRAAMEPRCENRPGFLALSAGYRRAYRLPGLRETDGDRASQS